MLFCKCSIGFHHEVEMIVHETTVENEKTTIRSFFLPVLFLLLILPPSLFIFK